MGEGQAKRAQDRELIPKSMLEGPIQSAADRPFHSMDAGEYAVRFRSETGLMLECAVSGDMILNARRKFGERLEHLSKSIGARIEVQELFKKRLGTEGLEPKNMVHSVLISGTFKEVVEAFKALGSAVSPSRAKEHRSVEKLASVQQSRPVETSQSAEKSQNSTDLDYPKAWTQGPVQTPTDLPSSALRLNTTAVRSRSTTHISLECAYSSDKIKELQSHFGKNMEFLQFRHGSEIKLQGLGPSESVSEHGASPGPASSTGTQSHPSILVSGTWHAVWKTVSDFWSKKLMNPEAIPTIVSAPSHILEPRCAIFRQGPASTPILEIIVTEGDWSHIKKQFHKVATALDVSLETGDIGARKALRGELPSRSVFLHGPLEGLYTLRKMLEIALSRPRHRDWLRENAAGEDRASRGEDQKKLAKEVEERTKYPFSSLVELYPHGEEHDGVKSRVILRLNDIRRKTDCSITGSRATPHLQLIRGEKESVLNARAMIVVELVKAYEKFQQPPRGIRVLHEQKGWDPTVQEISKLADKAARTKSGDPSNQSATTSQEFTPRPDRMTARCTVLFDDPKNFDVTRDILGLTNLEQLKRVSGCEHITLDDHALVAYGPFDSIVSFRKEMDRLSGEVGRKQKRAVHSPEFSIRVKVADTWARAGVMLRGASDKPSKDVAQLGEDVRVALRPLSHPVVLVASQAHQNESKDGVTADSPGKAKVSKHIAVCRGVTVSSFNTVTLQGDPIVSFNLKIPSRSWDAIAETGSLRIHLLSATPTGAAIADAFTKPWKHPYDGFLEVKKTGASVIAHHSENPPLIYHKEGVIAQIRAKLMPEKCVEVGDHIIVVARITGCHVVGENGAKAAPSEMDKEFWENIEGLAYAKQGYKTLGQELNQVLQNQYSRLPSDLPDPLSLGDEFVEQEATRGPASSGSEFGNINRGPAPVGDPVYDALAASKGAADSGEQVDFDKVMSGYEDDMSPAARDEEEDYDFGFETPSYGLKRDRRQNESTSKGEASAAGQDGPLWGPEDVAREDSIRLGGSAEPDSDAQYPGAEADQKSQPRGGDAKPPGIRAFSTFARPQPSTIRSTRHFSTIARTLQDNAPHNRPSIDHLIEPSARNTNVADYLGVPENARLHSHRVRGLIRMNKDARNAEHRLAHESDTLTEEEKFALRHKITNNDRIVVKKLAWNAAYHLRIMLDKGRVDFKRAQFLESAIEKGQAVLLEEAKLVKEMYHQGRIGEGDLRKVRERLENEAGVLRTELTRLGVVADEEGDVYPGGVDEGKGRGFDGFGGNL